VEFRRHTEGGSGCSGCGVCDIARSMESTTSPSSRRVLLLCDLQNDILVSLSTPMREEVVQNNKRLLDCARTAGITVIFVGVCFRAGCVSEIPAVGRATPGCALPHYPQRHVAALRHHINNDVCP
jgi:nicotinamidase-related amidase